MHKAKFWTPLHLIPLYLAATAVLFGQAAPQLNTKTDGTRILGIYVPGAPGYTLDLRVYLNSHQIQPKELLHSHTGIDFAMDLESPLVAGDSLYVVEVMPDGSKLTSNTIGIPPAPTPPDPIQLAVNIVDAVYGDTKPTVNFAPSNPALDGGTIKLVNGSQATTHTLTADELKNGSAVITLAQPLVHPESGDAIKITFDGSIKAGTKVKADADHAFGAVYARIHTHGPLREGDKEVTGSGGKTVTKVMGIVLEGSYSGPSRKTADAGTDDPAVDRDLASSLSAA